MRCMIIRDSYVLETFTVNAAEECDPDPWYWDGTYNYRVLLMQPADVEAIVSAGGGGGGGNVLLNLTAEQGWEVSGAIFSVWAAAWAFKKIYELVRGSDAQHES